MCCNHKYSDGKSSLLLENRFFGKYPKKYRGICVVCGEVVDITKEEYDKIREEENKK